MISPGKTRYIGGEYPGAEVFVKLVAEKFSLRTAADPKDFLKRVEGWASHAAYTAWKKAYASNAGNFLDHAVWGADRDLGDGHYLYGAMDDRYASNAARVFVSGGLAFNHVADKHICVIGAWDGTECLLMNALGARLVDAVDEVGAFCEMAQAQYDAWKIPGHVYSPRSLYEIDPESWWQTYDLVYVPGVLYHLTDLPTALVILWSILKPGGVLAFESFADAAPPEGPRVTARYLGPSVPGWNWWSPTTNCYEAMMHDCGFPDGRTVEFTGGRGWWVGTKAPHLPALANGSAGFSRPDVLRTIARLTGRR